ncbi:MAG TPA: PD-(D/E)XK nuclease family protein [Candidatus Limnocylindrales bacterium]|nr:PD-(D/E)XK nuclease family protein [Candidatus Limnocylindrales bacterium]
MPKDKYSAVWVSNSSIGDFISCERLYYLRNVYKDPTTGHKVNIINPSLALGQTVHEVLEALSILPQNERFSKSLIEKYDEVFKKVAGKLGGFKTAEQEEETKTRGIKMLKRVMDHPGPLLQKAIKIPKELPNYYLSQEANIILCGKIDWLEYLPSTDTLHIIDFKTGKNDENPNSLQLPIYYLLVENCQKRLVSKASYWYLDRDDTPLEMSLPDKDEAYERVLDLAKKVKQARLIGEYVCKKGGCFSCLPFEAILNREAEFVGVGGYKQDLYIL